MLGTAAKMKFGLQSKRATEKERKCKASMKFHRI